MKVSIKDIDIISDNARLIPMIRHFRGKYIPMIVPNPEYSKCKDDLILLMVSQRGHAEMVSKNIQVKLKAWTYKDISNILKVILDALEGAYIIKNDRYVTRCLLVKVPVKRGTLDRVEIDVEGEV